MVKSPSSPPCVPPDVWAFLRSCVTSPSKTEAVTWNAKLTDSSSGDTVSSPIARAVGGGIDSGGSSASASASADSASANASPSGVVVGAEDASATLSPTRVYDESGATGGGATGGGAASGGATG
eukprot:CAMPEP_0174732948 /NCGR_PEP_ID=MMETSP1094-20130205/60357_1 /TAXON_ID=156173 /ORGANISM="Chrysochromulina brevifilum, Strain UTEX LB 985" /LENGTH=123 /DNA_ID=CAMNT_0015935531 /DNA_START=78 /DNA_END=446 /DNA_ORIENTATION=+